MQEANQAIAEDVVEADPPEYRNYKEERKNRQVVFRPSDMGTLMYRRIPMCGHALIPGKEPRHRNCEACWFTFFKIHGELSQSCDEVFSKFGENGLKQLRPGKFTRNFLKFMATLAVWKKAMDQVEKDGEDSIAATPGSGIRATDGASDENEDTLDESGQVQGS